MPFHQCKHILIRNITASHILVNTLLLTLVKTMFGSQFDKAEKLLGETPDPLLVYGVEVSIQKYIDELSEPLRELYVVGYSLPTTSEYIYMSTAQKIQHIFSQYIKEAVLKDFYDMDIASAGITCSSIRSIFVLVLAFIMSSLSSRILVTTRKTFPSTAGFC